MKVCRDDTRMAECYVYSSIIHKSQMMDAIRMSTDEWINKIYIK